MEKVDYSKLGLKCGLEVHQQLDTGKLFIRTPSILTDEINFTIERKLRPVASEMGEYDKTAMEAYKREETFFYSGNNKNISLVELDEEPPQPLDKDALKTILEVSTLCNSTIVSTIIPMRKAIIDGSNTSAFQRTCLVAMGGEMKISTPTGEKRIGVQTIILEEDAARPIKKEEGKIFYNLDRLGIPLIELATDPDINTPEEAVLTAKKIGEIMRLTCKTKRGKGTIRQDINVSISEGARCEIKGCQELEMIGTVIEKEVERQLDLIKLTNRIKLRFVKKEELISAINNEIKNVSKIFSSTEAKFVKGKEVFGLKLAKMKGFLGQKVGAKRFGSELSAYAKASGVSGLLHRDELPNYGISEKEVNDTLFLLGCGEEDNFVLIVANKEKARKAFDAVKNRIILAYDGVVKETRGALEDASSEYQRPISGEARMYPETDIPYEKIDEKYLEEIKQNLPKNVKEREELYKKLGLSINHIEEMKLNNYARFFEELIKKGTNPTVSATTLLQTLTELRREDINVDKIKKESIEKLLIAEATNKINKSQIKKALIEISNGKSVEEIISSQKSINTSEIEPVIKKIVSKNEALVKVRGFGAIGPLMSDLLKEKELESIDKKILSEILTNQIKQIMKK
ncbi:MAG TPA: Glu-tRNA(Gln) amidotransferase subunit GatE [archaeon]|nr:Glu-tRNA(Gln) amidotransferase subunit GatE [archaeon]